MWHKQVFFFFSKGKDAKCCLWSHFCLGGETNEFHIAFPTTALETSDIVNNPAEEQISPLYESPARSMRMPFA